MSSIDIIEGVAELVNDIEQKMSDGTIELSAEEWVILDDVLKMARPLLERDDISHRNLSDAAWLIMASLEENKTLAKHFAHPLATLTSGTKPTGRMLSQPKRKHRLLTNQLVMLSFIERIKQENNAKYHKQNKNSESARHASV